MLRRISAAIRDTRILFWLGIAVILFAAFLAVPVVMRATDVRLYERIGTDAFAVHAPGMIPATLTWYPPPATVMMGFIKAATHLPFGIVWLVTITAMIIGAIMMTERRYGKSDALMVTMALAASVLLLGPHLAFSRFDIVAGLPILLGFVALRRGKTVDALVFMLLAGGIKLLPFALVPLVFLLRPKTEWRRLGIVSAIIIVGMAGVSLLLLGPTAIRAFMQEFFVFHAGRGFQVESIWSSVLLLVDHLRGTSSAVAYHHYAFHNDSLPSAMRGIGAIIYLSGMLFFLFRAWRMPTLSVSRHVLPLLLWMIAAASILSTGYLAWALPALFFALFRSADSIVLRKYQWWLTAGTVFTVAI
jgi:hypothetical protein